MERFNWSYILLEHYEQICQPQHFDCLMSRNLVDPSKKNEQILLDLLKVEANKYCADCGQKGNCI